MAAPSFLSQNFNEEEEEEDDEFNPAPAVGSDDEKDERSQTSAHSPLRDDEDRASHSGTQSRERTKHGLRAEQAEDDIEVGDEEDDKGQDEGEDEGEDLGDGNDEEEEEDEDEDEDEAVSVCSYIADVVLHP